MFHSDSARVSYDDDDEDEVLEVLIERLYDTHKDYDDGVIDLVNRVLWIKRDIELLGSPLTPPTEEEMAGLRILIDETNRFEKYKLDQADKKLWQTDA